MEPKTEIKKVERTDGDVDNSYYEFKIPYDVEDDYGNKATFYKKETKLCVEYDKEIADQIATHQEEIVKLSEKKVELEEINSN